MREATFVPQKAVEYLLYLAAHVQNADMHKLLKLRYFADKLHLSRYGMLASGDRYVAMERGPVASQTYDLLKAVRDKNPMLLGVPGNAAAAEALDVSGYSVTALREPNLDYLSRSDIECMNEAIRLYGQMPFGKLTDASHDSAWDKGWEKCDRRTGSAGPMELIDIVGTLANADEVRDHISA